MHYYCSDEQNTIRDMNPSKSSSTKQKASHKEAVRQTASLSGPLSICAIDKKGADLESAPFHNELEEVIAIKLGTTSYKPTPQVLSILGMTQRRFTNIYRKYQNPTFEETVALCKYFDCSIQDLAPTDQRLCDMVETKLLAKHG